MGCRIEFSWNGTERIHGINKTYLCESMYSVILSMFCIVVSNANQVHQRTMVNQMNMLMWVTYIYIYI